MWLYWRSSLFCEKLGILAEKFEVAARYLLSTSRKGTTSREACRAKVRVCIISELIVTAISTRVAPKICTVIKVPDLKKLRSGGLIKVRGLNFKEDSPNFDVIFLDPTMLRLR